MIEVGTAIKKRGNVLYVLLPPEIVRASDLKLSQRVSISVLNGEIIIKPIIRESLTLEQRLALFNPTEHGGEVMIALQHIERFSNGHQ